MGRITNILAQRVADGLLSHDPAQIAAAAALDDVRDRLNTKTQRRWFSRPQPVTGLYLWGGVGRGKSMLMDVFVDASEVPARRVHFHAFMSDVQDRLHTARQRREVSNPILPVAKQLASEVRLICFDEFQVTQIADAMILAGLFEALFARGVTMIATSNRHPDTLYENGLNRHLFLPFIALLKQRCCVFELSAARDYRLERLTEAPAWHVGAQSADALDRTFSRLTLGADPNSCVLTIRGRELTVSRQAAGVARFCFEELCAQPLWAEDYREIAATFHTVILENIPRLSRARRNQAARFLALIDTLYEARVKLVASADAEPEALYTSGDGSFEFKRTVSRLHEMRSREYMALPHIPAPA